MWCCIWYQISLCCKYTLQWRYQVYVYDKSGFTADSAGQKEKDTGCWFGSAGLHRSASCRIHSAPGLHGPLGIGIGCLQGYSSLWLVAHFHAPVHHQAGKFKCPRNVVGGLPFHCLFNSCVCLKMLCWSFISDSFVGCFVWLSWHFLTFSLISWSHFSFSNYLSALTKFGIFFESETT